MSLANLVKGFFRKKQDGASGGQDLPGRDEGFIVREPHKVLRTPIMPDYPEDCHVATFAMGCFWGVEKLFWELDGVYTTSVGYCGGTTKNPTYEEVCTGRTGHAEAVQVVYWPNKIKYQQLLELFWSSHNPTQGMRQGNDKGPQYRSAIFFHTPEQERLAQKSMEQYQEILNGQSGGNITTEVVKAEAFYLAEAGHQQYLEKNPNGYCNLQTIDKSGLPKPQLAIG